MHEVQKMLIELVKADFPYLECALSKDMRSEVNYPPLIPVEGLKRGASCFIDRRFIVTSQSEG